MISSEEQIQQLQAELAALRREMQDFTATVSHDLRAPLRHITSFAQLVQEDAGPQLSAEVQGFLATITGSAQQMARMLDALLEWSHIGAQSLQTAPVQLAAALEPCRAALQLRYATRTIEWRVAEGLPSVLADPLLLQMVLRAVLDNALKFSAGRAIAVVEIGAESAGGQVTLTVKDNGAGFSPAAQSKLFQPYSRLHSARDFPGLGMGLACAHKAVQRMGGDLALEGQIDQGCTVRLRLPAAVTV